jgi:hypothetical protein
MTNLLRLVRLCELLHMRVARISQKEIIALETAPLLSVQLRTRKYLNLTEQYFSIVTAYIKHLKEWNDFRYVKWTGEIIYIIILYTFKLWLEYMHVSVFMHIISYVIFSIRFNI